VSSNQSTEITLHLLLCRRETSEQTSAPSHSLQ